MEDTRWRLMTNPNGDPQGERLILEANAGQPLRYQPPFAATRRLPRGGELPVDYIREVVLGWSHTDEAWHLGLLLGPYLAEARGSRWCEIAYWPDPDKTVFYDLAHEAGESLARTLGRPFDFIQPREQPTDVPALLPLAPLPARCGDWLLQSEASDNSEASGLRFTRARSWATARLTRIGWYSFWVVVYVILSLSTLRTDLALPNAGTMLPNPELLPYLGLGAAVVLLGMIGFSVYELFTVPNRIVVDPQQRSVTALRGNRARWQLGAGDVQSVYVTQVVNKRGRKRIIYYGALNLHLGGGTFHPLLVHPEQEENAAVDRPAASEGVELLRRGTGQTDLQVIGLHLAAALGDLPCWYDQRLR